jgi:hypothetical protein
MTRHISFLMTVAIVLLLACMAGVPVSGLDNSSAPYITATSSPTKPLVGDNVTISGTATGGNLTSSAQIWIFAGSYVNVTTVPVSANGSYTKTFSTAGLPPATYYVFVQYSGGDNTFNITTTGYAGQVVNTRSGETIFNFTGTGSVQNESAMMALGNALNTQGTDDVYTKLTIVLASPDTNTTANVTTSATKTASLSPTTLPQTTKTPLPATVVLAGIGIASLFFMELKRR